MTICIQALLICATVTLSFAQNLVPNPSFEQVNQNYCGDFALPEQFEATMKYWILATRAKPRISDKDAGPGCWNYVSDSDPIQPHSGKRMILLNLHSGASFRPYLEVALLEPLEDGKEYFTEVWVHSIQDHQEKSNIGLYFSDSLVRVRFDKLSYLDRIPFMRGLPFNPQINHTEVVSYINKWVCLKASFIAKSRANIS